MKKILIILIAVLSVGAVLAFTYFAPSTGMQGFIRKKGESGGEEIVRKNFDISTNSRTSNQARGANISCSDSYSIVDQKLNEIKNANTKIDSSYPVIQGLDEVSPISETYASGMNELDTAVLNYKTAYENYNKGGCKNDACNNTIQPVNDSAAELYSTYVKTYNLSIDRKDYKDQWDKKYVFQNTKLTEELAQQISDKEKNRVKKEINALNTNSEILAIKKKLEEIEVERQSLQTKLSNATTNSKKAVKSFNTQCKK